MQVVERRRGGLGVFIWKMRVIKPTSQDELGGFEHIVGASLSLSFPRLPSVIHRHKHTLMCVLFKVKTGSL